MTGPDRSAVRLSAVAALMDLNREASRAADAWIKRDGGPYGDSEAALIDSATSEEHQLAEALHGRPLTDVTQLDAAAIAELLRLAADIPTAPKLASGLLQTFLIPDDSRHALALDESTTAFAEVYRTLALPQIPPAAAGRAGALLEALSSLPAVAEPAIGPGEGRSGQQPTPAGHCAPLALSSGQMRAKS